MNKRTQDTLKTILLLIPLITLTKVIPQLPWWGFVVPVILTGIVIGWKKWRVHTFLTGFLLGFIIWFGADLYFSTTLNSIVLSRLGLLLSVPPVVVLLVTGIIGGLLTGLALWSGKSIFTSEKVSAPAGQLA